MNMDDLKQSCYELSLPVTEKCNPISRDIDKANGKQMVQILRRCDAEIFEKKINHDPCHQKLYNSSVIQTMVDVAKRAEMMLRTSFNEMLKAQKQKQICSYIIAGGDRALLTSQEAPEDDPALGARTLDKVCTGKKHVLFIGISCGMSVVNDFDDIRGFINNGFSEMKNKEGDLSSLGPQFVIGHKDFVDAILPSLSPNDMILFLFTANDDLHEVTALADQVRRRTSNLHAIAHDLEKLTVPERICNMFETVLHITWSFSSEEMNSFVMRQRWELSTKWCLNAISTGAHVMKGKVYMNYMIDLRVTNSKLYRRAINILQVVPTALVMIQCSCTLAEARHHLDCHPVIRDAVSACFSSSKNKSTVD
ncbi:glucokinase regulatory [Labeo rohita]|uniref:Glucokinase regulatory n=1 Tax=Labeo rohita TaxID=84645 RepID=A0A498N8Q5_LABRO|nr:glucokinase regulatory [Labeo rohita]